MASVNIPAALTGVTTTQLNITGVELTYIIPNRDLLTFQSFKPLAGWSYTIPTNTTANTTGTADTIVVKLTGGALTPNQLNASASSFGQFVFSVDLDKTVNSTPVWLQSVVLDTGASGSLPVGPASCIATAFSSDSMSLVLACGDQTLRDVMNGVAIGPFIGPATPDPVTGGNVTFKYSNNGAMSLSLAVYDELGNVVAQPVNNVYHEAGSWQVTTDVSKLPSGTYTYRLSGNSVQAGMMVRSSQFVIAR